MPIIRDYTDIGYRIKRPNPDIEYKGMEEVSENMNRDIPPKIDKKYVAGNKNKDSIPEYKDISYVEPNRQKQILNKNYVEYIKDNLHKDFIPEYKLSNVAPDMNMDKKSGGDMKLVSPDMNLDKKSGFETIQVAPDMNPDKKSGFETIQVAPDMNLDKKSGFETIQVAPDMNPDKKSGGDMKLVSPDMNPDKTQNFDTIKVAPDMNTDKSAFGNYIATISDNQQGDFIPDNSKKTIYNNPKNPHGEDKSYVVNESPNKSWLSSIKNTLDDAIRELKNTPEKIGNMLKDKAEEIKQSSAQAAQSFIHNSQEALIKDPLKKANQIISNPASIKDILDKDKMKESLKTKGESFAGKQIEVINRATGQIGLPAIPVYYSDNYQVNSLRSKIMEVYNKDRGGIEDVKEGDVIKKESTWDKITGNTFANGIKNIDYEKIEKQAKQEAAKQAEKIRIKKNLPLDDTKWDNTLERQKQLNVINEKLGTDFKFLEDENVSITPDVAGDSTPVRKNVFNSYEVDQAPDNWNEMSNIPLFYSPTSSNDSNLQILDNKGHPQKDVRNPGDKIYVFNGYREGPFTSAMESIFKGIVGFQGVPDIWVDISIKPHHYTFNSLEYYPPEYPAKHINGYMLSAFQVRDIQMTTEDSWNLGPYGNIPITLAMILPTALTITFVADANLWTHKWIMATMEYMFGARLDIHSMRPFKMCCHDITLYTTTFYGECLYARTYIAYPMFNFDSSMLGTGGVKHFDTDWVIVGMKEYQNAKISVQKEMVPEVFNNTDNIMFQDANGETSITSLPELEAKFKEQGRFIHGDTKLTAVAGEYAKNVTEHTNSYKALALNKLKTTAKLDPNLITTLANGGDILSAIKSNLSLATGMRTIVCIYCSIYSTPLPKDNGINFNIPEPERFRINDDLAAERALEYVNKFKDMIDCVKIILGSADGVPGMNEYAKKMGARSCQDGGFFLGGIGEYTEDDFTGKNKDSDTMLFNRRADIIQVSELSDEAKIAMVGTSDDEEFWKNIPDVCYGRELSGARNFPNRVTYNNKGVNYSNLEDEITKYKAQSSNGKASAQSFNSVGGARAVPDVEVIESINKEERVKKADEIMLDLDQKFVTDYKENSDDYDYVYEYGRKESLKVNTDATVEDVYLGETYELYKVKSYNDIQNKTSIWWKENFGNNTYSLSISNTTLEEILNDDYEARLPIQLDSDIIIPVINYSIMSYDLIPEEDNLLYLLNNYFKKNKLLWFYNTSLDELILYQKQPIQE